MALVEVKVPDIGDFSEVAIIELLVKPGDTVKAEQSLITVESDKASMEIPSSHAGVVKELKVALGDKVNKGSLIAVLEGAGGAAPAPSPQPSPAGAGEGAKPAPAPSSAPAGEGRGEGGGAARVSPTASLPPHDPGAPKGALPHASPSIRRFARDLGVPLDEVKGSGPKGRITQDDVQGFVKSVMAGTAQTKASAA
jgi:pyruvate dehydrogenase E2 component (dihydrolipoamide acetyltransferase)